MKALQPLIDCGQVVVTKPITSIDDPILQLQYTPFAPSFTIRSILTAISSSGPPKSPSSSNFKPTLYYPPSLESLTQRVQRRERKDLLFRFFLTVLTAIPAFIIGIIFASLLPSTHPLRLWAEAPIWSGTTSRFVWVLFILATPVQFYCAAGFHTRSIKEIKALWRKGSTTPVWKRFVCFGSMNLLISLGVSVSYFSSIALLVISAMRSKNGQGDSTTYFDSAIFLTMFLLFGEFLFISALKPFGLSKPSGKYLEAYSRSKTADAVSSLSKLRPATALLVGPAEDVHSHVTKGQFEGEFPDLEKGSTDTEYDGDRIAGVTRIPIDSLEIFDIVRVVPGSSPPADGIIISEEGTLFDESSLTGESLPVAKHTGDRVFVGTVCKSKPVDVRVEKLTGETM